MSLTIDDRATVIREALARALHPDEIVAREGTREVRICAGTACHASGRPAVTAAFRDQLAEQGLSDTVRVVETGCHGFCEQGPIVVLEPRGLFYPRVRAHDVAGIIAASIAADGIYDKRLYKDPATGEPVPYERDIPFYAGQKRLVLGMNGKINPYSIDDYLALGGYRALAKVLEGNDPVGVIDTVEAAGLRGRGGAGFPAGKKWRYCRANPGDCKYVICNGDEGDPGAFMDRSVLEGNPHSVMEGMIIAAFAIGSGVAPVHGYVYVRAEYPFAVQRLEAALVQARQRGLLGHDILGSGFDFDIIVNQGAGAFVCGESTALTASIEGQRGMPRGKHIRTVAHGLWQQPTNLNNVETFANVPWIVLNGVAAYQAMGTETSKGTKIFSLTGKLKNGGLVEVPMGASLREVIFDIGGGIPGGRKFKGVQTGGPSGGILPESKLDLPVDFDTLTEAGSMMGSGGMIVMDDRACIVDVVRYFTDFLCDESCGKCTPCREGLVNLRATLERICAGKGEPQDLGLLEDFGAVLEKGSLCALGQGAANPVMSSLRYFRAEYEKHILEHKCPAGVCKALIQFTINDKCNGCTQCVKPCPTEAITGKLKELHLIDESKCIQCGTCVDACKFDAITVE